jgi:hypothetical protein
MAPATVATSAQYAYLVLARTIRRCIPLRVCLFMQEVTNATKLHSFKASGLANKKVNHRDDG